MELEPESELEASLTIDEAEKILENSDGHVETETIPPVKVAKATVMAEASSSEDCHVEATSDAEKDQALQVVDDTGQAGTQEREEGVDEQCEKDKSQDKSAPTTGEDSSADGNPVDMDAVDGGSIINDSENFVIENKELECLFFGSFYNEKQLKEPALDLVTFSTPCKITEIRIIPLGATVELLDGVALLGSTNPTNFEVELYYEDLTDPAHTTFKEISTFTYDHKLAISSLCGSDESPIITNKVVVRGVYNSITLAIIGHQVENFPMKTPPPETVRVKSDFYEQAVDSEGAVFDEDWDDGDRSPGEHSVYSDELEHCKAEDEEESNRCDADDDVEMKDAFDPILGIEFPSQNSPSPKDNLSLSPSQFWGEKDVESDSETLDQTPPPDDDHCQIDEEPLSTKSKSPEPIGSLPYDQQMESDIEEKVSIISLDEYHQRESEDESLSPVDKVVEHESMTSLTHSQPVTCHPKLETEDISDGDISSIEEEDIRQSFQETEKDTDSTSMHVKPISKSSPGGERVKDLEKINETKENEILDQDFEDDFEDHDLEVVSDDEIGDDYGSEGGEDLALWEDLGGDIYEYPLDLDSFELYRPQHLRLEPKARLTHHSALKEKLILGLKIYGRSTFSLEMMENWVELMEEVLTILTPYIRSLSAAKEVETLHTLLFWVQRSFQFEPASTPESATRTLRQLKVALKLVFLLCEFGWSFSVTVSQLVIDPIQQATVQQRVAQILLESRIPAVQCLCVKVLESTLNTQIGFKSFVAKKDSELSIFEQLLTNIMELKLNTLVYASIGPVFQTVSLIPLLLELGNQSDIDIALIHLRATLDVIEEIQQRACSSSTMRNSSVVSAENVVSIYLPSYDARVSFVKLLKETRFLDSCYKLLRNFDGNESHRLVDLVLTIFETLLKWEVGIVFLSQHITMDLLTAVRKSEQKRATTFATYFCHCTTVLKCVDKCQQKFHDLGPEEMEILIDTMQECFLLLSSDIGRKAVTRILTTGNFIDGLLNCARYCDEASGADKMQELEKSAIGGYIVELLVHVLRTGHNFAFLKAHGNEICQVYDSLGENFEGYSKLTEVIGFVRPTMDRSHFTIQGVGDICERVKTEIEEKLFKCSVNWGVPPELVTELRILESLCISLSGMDGLHHCDIIGKTGRGSLGGESLPQKHVVVNMNSADILSHLAEILKKVTSEYQQPGIHAHTFLFSKGEALAALILPTVRIIRKLLTELILVRNTSFRDLTLIPMLLETFVLVEAFPEEATAKEMIMEIRAHIVGSLQTYTIPVMKVGDGAEEELVNSIWTKMMSELISFTTTSPLNFIPGMTILSELQPLKLPMVANEELSETEKLHLISLRKLWSAFLHGVTAPLQEMLGLLCESTNRELLTLVRRVCNQIADLSAPSCLVVCRGLMEPILNSIEVDLEEKLTTSSTAEGTSTRASSSSVTDWVEGSLDRRSIQCSARTVRLLGFLTGLMRNSGILKAGVIQILRGTFKIDEKFSEFPTLLESILRSSSTEGQKQSIQIKANSHVLSFFCTLCNLRVTMFGDVDGEYLKANCLPPKETMTVICTSLISFLSQEKVLGNVAMIRKIFYTLNVIGETDYGFYHLRTALSKNTTAINDLIQKIRRRDLGNMDIVGVMESVEVVDGLLSFLRKLITPMEKLGGIDERKTILSKTELRKVLGWKSPESLEYHPLVQLCTYFVQYVTREQSAGGSEEYHYLKTYLKEVKQKLEKVVTFINSTVGDNQVSIAEVILVPPETLQEQFGRRPISIPCQFETTAQRLNYLSQVEHGGAEINFEFSMEDLVFRDLMSTINDFSKETETEFLTELEKFCNLKRNSIASDGKTDESKENSKDISSGPTAGTNSASQRSNLSGLSGSLGEKNSFARGAGAIGRVGFSRGLMHSRPGFDPFRSRPPNTSRPPSLHVDDFVAMESSSQSCSGSGRGKIGTGVDNFRGVGRGHGTPSPLTRSFNPPERSGRGFLNRSSPGTTRGSYYPRNEPSPARGRQPPARGRGYGEVSGDRWLGQSGGEGSQSSHYERGDRESSYSDRRFYGGRGYGDQRGGGGRSPGNSGSNSSQPQQQRWRSNAKFSR